MINKNVIEPPKDWSNRRDVSRYRKELKEVFKGINWRGGRLSRVINKIKRSLLIRKTEECLR